MNNNTILVIDDDRSLCQLIKFQFEDEGATVLVSHNGREGLKAFFVHRPDLVILDIRMPEMGGWEVCKQIRAMSDTPIIMLTTIHRDEDMVRGLNSGADDFVTKPFQGDILMARAKAVLRRVKADVQSSEQSEPVFNGYDDGYLTIDLDARTVHVDGKLIKLTSTEHRLLHHLVSNRDQILSYEKILDHVWGWEYADSTEYVHVYLSQLRRKIEKDSRNPIYLRTQPRMGCGFWRAKKGAMKVSK